MPLVWLYCNLRLAMRTQSLEQQNMAQPWVVLEEEEEEQEKEEGFGSGGNSVMRIEDSVMRIEYSREEAELHEMI